MEDREAVRHDDEREAVVSADDVEGHALIQDDKSAAANGDEDEERRAFPASD